MDDSKSESKKENARSHVRGDVSVTVDIRMAGGVRTRGLLIDISQTGFRLECMTVLTVDKPIFVTIPTFAQMEARITWGSDWVYGCIFSHPLHPAIFEHILKKHPAFARPLS